METQPYHQRIHPDDRDAVREAFRNTAPEMQELDFRAGPGETGRYERFRMTVYHYQRGAELIRIIAAIRREGETQGPPV